MDKIWDRDPLKSEVIGRCDEDEKNEWPRRTDNSRTLKKRGEKLTSFQWSLYWCGLKTHLPNLVTTFWFTFRPNFTCL